MHGYTFLDDIMILMKYFENVQGKSRKQFKMSRNIIKFYKFVKYFMNGLSTI